MWLIFLCGVFQVSIVLYCSANLNRDGFVHRKTVDMQNFPYLLIDLFGHSTCDSRKYSSLKKNICLQKMTALLY